MERRLAAILAADVVGYSRLMGADEAGTLVALNAHREQLIDRKIADHRGRLVKLTGDGMLVEFPSVVNAVSCAADIQRNMLQRNAEVPEDRRITFRVGVHLGDVIVEGDDIFGDGVNVAARLEGLAAPGGIVISSTVRDHIGNRLDLAFEDMGEQTLKNIARPVHVYRAVMEVGHPNPDLTISEKLKTALALPDKPSIAVLPFQNMSDEAGQEYFADGMVEDIITGLSRIKWLFVIARNSSFVYKQKAVDVRQVGRDLGVRYVVEGSVRKVGTRLRVTVQLVEAETGAHLWADKYDGALEDVFEFQDQITERLVGIVEPSVRKSEVERSRRKRPENLDAYDLFLRAMPYLQARMPDQGRLAIPLLEKALSLDPDYPAAHAHLAWCHEWCFTRGGLDEADRNVALFHARTTIGSDTDDAAALAVAGWVVIVLSKEHELAIAAIERALSLNPSCAAAHYFAALVNSFANKPEATAFHAKQALRLSPFDPSAFEAHLALGMAAVGQSHFEDAASHLTKASQINPRHSVIVFMHAIALALAGRANESEGLIRRGLELEAGFRIRIFYEFGMAPSLADKFIEGARMLGLPE